MHSEKTPTAAAKSPETAHFAHNPPAALNEHQTKILQEVPEIYRETFAKAFRGESRTSAVKAFCLRCVGYKREDVKGCTGYGCPLHPYRPFV